MPIPSNAIIRRDEEGIITWWMVPTQVDTHYFDGIGYMGTMIGEDDAEGEEVARISLKWDGCCHIGFRDPTMDKEWVHVCGRSNLESHLAMLRWMWDEAQARITAYDKEIGK